MTHIDPLKLVRNTETLHAYREYQRAVRRAGQPWLAIALVAASLEIGLFLFALARSRLHDLSLISSLLVMVFGLSFFMGGLRAWLYRRSHPFTLPEAPSVFGWRNNLR